MAFKHLVTSGCSFSDNVALRWPHYLAARLGIPLYNRGHGSAGNDWIAESTIYQISQLLNEGVDPKEILVVVMWSGIDRTNLFISQRDTPYFNDLLADNPREVVHPINYTDSLPNTHLKADTDSGYLPGSLNCVFNNQLVTRMKQRYISQFMNAEWLLIKSLNSWLQLQWMCDSYGITLHNFTYMDLWHYPYYKFSSPQPNLPLFYESYSKNTKHLFDLIDISRWHFGDNYTGMYEWCKTKQLEFYPDNFHPYESAHSLYVENFICPSLNC